MTSPAFPEQLLSTCVRQHENVRDDVSTEGGWPRILNRLKVAVLLSFEHQLAFAPFVVV